MKKNCLAIVAVLLVSMMAFVSCSAETIEGVDHFDQEYRQILQDVADGKAHFVTVPTISDAPSPMPAAAQIRRYSDKIKYNNFTYGTLFVSAMIEQRTFDGLKSYSCTKSSKVESISISELLVADYPSSHAFKVVGAYKVKVKPGYGASGTIRDIDTFYY